MIAQTVLKLLDESVLPAVIVIAAKVLGLALANLVNNLPYTIQVGGSVLPWSVVYNSAVEANTANTFSNIVMFVVVLVCFGVILFRAHFLHSTHIPPKLSGKLAQLKLEHFILDTFEIYHQALIWLSFLWITTLILFTYSFAGGSISVGLIGLLISCGATYLYVKDVEVELVTQRLIREST